MGDKISNEDKELFLKDICARTFYNVKVSVPILSFVEGEKPCTGPIELVSVNVIDGTCTVGNKYAQTSGVRMFTRGGKLICKPFLRPMSDMTEEEKNEYRNIDNRSYSCPMDYAHIPALDRIDWLNAHHIDFRGLIQKGLAIETTKEMYEEGKI